MPVTRLYPNATTSGGGLTTNAASHHAGLSDASDATHSSAQLSVSEPVKFATGPSITQLPTLSGKMKGVTVNARAYLVGGSDGHLTLVAGENSNNRLAGVAVTTVATTHSSAQINMGNFAAVNALAWQGGFQWVQTAGVQGFLTELNFDVEWSPVSGFSAFIVELLGPLVAVGLHEMPRLSAELWLRSRTRLLTHEIAEAWRDLRADPRRRFFVPGSAAQLKR